MRLLVPTEQQLDRTIDKYSVYGQNSATAKKRLAQVYKSLVSLELQQSYNSPYSGAN